MWNMMLSRCFSRHSAAAALLAACVAANCANAAFAAGQADAPGGAGPAADADAGGRGPDQRHGPLGERGQEDGPQHGFGGSRPGAPGLDGPSPSGSGPHEMPPRGPGGFGLFGRLHHLRLSEAQQDKLFAIMHAAAPQQRNQQKAERKAHEALRALGNSAQFDEARAKAAARELGQAVADGALLRARLESQVLAMLTPEQREQLRRERPPGPPEHDGS
jgi:protein CpxP